MRPGVRFPHNGLTLGEVIVALGLLAIVTLSLLAAFTSGVRMMSQSTDLSMATDCARDFMETVKSEGYDLTAVGKFDGRLPTASDSATGFPPNPYPVATRNDQNYSLVVDCTQHGPTTRLLQVFTARLTRAAERSSFDSLAIDMPDPHAASFLSALDANGVFQFDPYLQRPRWQNRLIFYRDTSSGDIREIRRSVVGTPHEVSPRPILPTGAARTADHLVFLRGGKPLVQDTVSLSFRIVPLALSARINHNERLQATLVVEKSVRGQTTPRRLESIVQIKFRN